MKAATKARDTIQCGDVIRYRKGATALMMVHRMDNLCGYWVCHGVHLYGEEISVPYEGCRRANAEESRDWQRYKYQRGEHVESQL